mmetsp:Transcript_82568/g.145702  ORF Transcript_82568/g.145702 Transcript_82568/m.145702 type:complete len:260 (+) Transcript_82568:92-871(+)
MAQLDLKSLTYNIQVLSCILSLLCLGTRGRRLGRSYRSVVKGVGIQRSQSLGDHSSTAGNLRLPCFWKLWHSGSALGTLQARSTRAARRGAAFQVALWLWAICQRRLALPVTLRICTGRHTILVAVHRAFGLSANCLALPALFVSFAFFLRTNHSALWFGAGLLTSLGVDGSAGSLAHRWCTNRLALLLTGSFSHTLPPALWAAVELLRRGKCWCFFGKWRPGPGSLRGTSSSSSCPWRRHTCSFQLAAKDQVGHADQQ